MACWVASAGRTGPAPGSCGTPGLPGPAGCSAAPSSSASGSGRPRSGSGLRGLLGPEPAPAPAPALVPVVALGLVLVLAGPPGRGKQAGGPAGQEWRRQTGSEELKGSTISRCLEVRLSFLPPAARYLVASGSGFAARQLPDELLQAAELIKERRLADGLAQLQVEGAAGQDERRVAVEALQDVAWREIGPPSLGCPVKV